jgi:hypothetical protein
MELFPKQASWLDSGCVSGVDSGGRTSFLAEAHRGEGKRFVVHAEEKLSAFVEVELATRLYRQIRATCGLMIFRFRQK